MQLGLDTNHAIVRGPVDRHSEIESRPVSRGHFREVGLAVVVVGALCLRTEKVPAQSLLPSRASVIHPAKPAGLDHTATSGAVTTTSTTAASAAAALFTMLPPSASPPREDGRACKSVTSEPYRVAWQRSSDRRFRSGLAPRLGSEGPSP